MAGINRLGKGPAKPGTMRPQDPNKYKTMDIFSEGTEGDREYARMVQDIEDTQQNHTGWLFSRGAFDKGDLLYLRDEEEKRRYAEQELRDSELRSFARMRQKVDGLQYGEHPSNAEMAANEPADQSRPREKTWRPLVRVKPTAKVKREGAQEPDSKRLKTENGLDVAAARTVPREIKTEDGSQDNAREDANGANLAGLLGGYDSDSDGSPAGLEAAPQEARRDSPTARALPLPELHIKREVKREPPDEAPAAEPAGDVDEEVDFDDSTSDSAAS